MQDMMVVGLIIEELSKYSQSHLVKLPAESVH